MNSVILSLCFLGFSTFAYADGASPEDADVGPVQQKYWAHGDQSELGVVQNRVFSTRGKFEFEPFAGIVFTDPFLSVKALGGSMGYHLSDTWSFHLLGWKDFVSNSSALNTLQTTLGATANTNNPSGFVGGEASLSAIYGKLSWFGNKILYYDFHLLAGAGATFTETGTDFTPTIGLGQQTYISENVAIRLDYRLTPYYEAIPEKEIPSQLGQIVDHRWNWSQVVTLGVSFMIGGGS